MISVILFSIGSLDDKRLKSYRDKWRLFSIYIYRHKRIPADRNSFGCLTNTWYTILCIKLFNRIIKTVFYTCN